MTRMTRAMTAAVFAGAMSLPVFAFGGEPAAQPPATTATAQESSATKAPVTPWWSTETMKKNWGEWVDKFAAAHEKLVAAQKAVKDAQASFATEKDRAKRQELRTQILSGRKAELVVRIEWYQLHATFREAQHKKAVESYDKEAKTRAEQIKKLQDQLAAMKSPIPG